MRLKYFFSLYFWKRQFVRLLRKRFFFYRHWPLMLGPTILLLGSSLYFTPLGKFCYIEEFWHEVSSAKFAVDLLSEIFALAILVFIIENSTNKWHEIDVAVGEFGEHVENIYGFLEGLNRVLSNEVPNTLTEEINGVDSIQTRHSKFPKKSEFNEYVYASLGIVPVRLYVRLAELKSLMKEASQDWSKREVVKDNVVGFLSSLRRASVRANDL